MQMMRDLRFGIRALLKDKGFSATVILTLALCIGANTAIFAIVNSVLLRPLPVPRAGEIVLMSNQYPNAGSSKSTNSGGADYFDRRRDMTVFSEQAMFNGDSRTIEVDGVPQRVTGMTATPTLFRLLEVRALYGRTFTDEEGEIGHEDKVLLSYGFWKQMFSGSPDAIGKTLRMNNRPFIVVGVMPQNFQFVDPEVRYWVPLAFTEKQKEARHSSNWHNIGRLKPGATIQQARAQLDAINAANDQRFPQ